MISAWKSGIHLLLYHQKFTFFTKIEDLTQRSKLQDIVSNKQYTSVKAIISTKPAVKQRQCIFRESELLDVNIKNIKKASQSSSYCLESLDGIL